MSATATVATAKGIMLAKRHWKKFVYGFLILILLLVSAVLALESADREEIGTFPGSMGTIDGKAQVPDYIAKWRGLLFHYTEIQGIEKYTEFLLALIYQELGSSDTLDVMQASESLGLPPNAIQDPARSIEVGVHYFKTLLQIGEDVGVDFNTIVQSYNFGTGYIYFIADHGGEHSVSLAKQFANKQAGKLGWDSYGDIHYVEHVMTKLSGGTQQGNVDIVLVDNETLQAILDSMMQFSGDPYVWAGDNPSTGFDCSGLMMWTFRQAGINIPRTAQAQFNASQKISIAEAKPGDLVFFEDTYETAKRITHVGIYVGGNRMFNTNSSGVGFTNIYGDYWAKHFVGFGRIANFE